MMSVTSSLIAFTLQAVTAGRARRCCQAMTRAAVARRDAGARNARPGEQAMALRAHSSSRPAIRQCPALACGVFP